MISPRSPETEALYQEFKKTKQALGVDTSEFNLAEETIVREFTHWLIIENRFPYDNMTSVNHMLIPRRKIHDLSEADSAEMAEHQIIKKTLIKERFYDAIVENLPRSKSVSQHIHLHLVRWKYTTDDGRNKSELKV